MKRAIFWVALLFGSSGVTFFAGRSFGWWQLPAGKVFAMTAALAISIVLLLPALGAAERRSHDRPEFFWLWLLVAFVLTGIVTFVAGEWLIERDP